LFAILRRHDVDFIVIVGLAAAANGAGWPTNDADVVIQCSESTFVALDAALNELDAEYDTPHVPPIRPDLHRLRSLPGPQLFRTTCGRLDVLKDAGGETFETLARDALTAQLHEASVRYASVEALLRMKRAANRPKDREGIRLLEAALKRERG
jgi:hypothetical protein